MILETSAGSSYKVFRLEKRKEKTQNKFETYKNEGNRNCKNVLPLNVSPSSDAQNNI